jgi:amino acid adenylation domain-containing protein
MKLAGVADRVALRFAGASITYGELDRKSAELAGALAARGFGRESLAGLAIPRSADLVIWAWACWRAGGSFLPLDPSYPAERLKYMLDDAKPALVIVDGAAPPWAPGAIDRAAIAVGAAHDATPEPGDLACVIYTSGSTGRPKGVEVPFRGIANLAAAQREVFAITPESHILQFASPSFDAFVAEMVSALLAGASLHIPSASEVRPGPDLSAFCAREAITVATFPPSLLAILEPREFPTLRTVVSAGEACSAEVARRWSDRRFVNAYGPTETTVCAIEGVVDVAGTPPIGRPLPNVDVYVLDDDLRPVPDDEIGELYIGGIGLARGYRGRADLTASAFVERDGQRLYRTGDRARRDADGQYYFAGRLDDQIKLRGHRIELGEIEHALRALPEIADAAVAVRESPRAGVQLVAHVVPRGEIDGAAIRARLQTTLAPFMVPDVVSPIAELPRSPNGKIDRDALPAPRPFRPPSAPAPVAASSDAEAYVLRLFRHTLGIESLGIDDDFFAMGGHSLGAAILLAQIAAERSISIPMTALVKHPTPRALARHLATAPENVSCVVPLQVRSSKRALFLVHPVGGNAGCYLDLAAALADDLDVYGIQNPALFGGAVEPRTIEDMCAEYAAAIRAVQPEGPYFIGGWSVGGNFAIEVARSLAASGGGVGPLVLLDSWSPLLLPDPRPRPDDAMMTWMFIKNNLGRAAGIDIPITPDETKPLSPQQRIELVRTWATRLGTLPADVSLDHLQRLVDVYAQTLRAHLAYFPKPYLGSGVHIQASSPAKGHPRPPTLGWEGVLPNVRTVIIPDTTHFVFVYPPMLHKVVPLVREALGT